MNTPEESRPLHVRLAAAVMVCNPLLLLSPMCLLYGIYRAVIAPNLFATDAGNTIFNFIALALYVLMVCVISTLLARRKILPDTIMLLLLNGLLFVAPFILIAHGVFLEGHLAIALGILGIAMSKGQLEILRRRLPDSFMSPQLMIGAALVLAVNFAAPVVFRHGLENDNEAWGRTSDYAWYLVLPLLVAWLNALPDRTKFESLWARPWFPTVIYGLWLIGTCVELWTVAYVDDRKLHSYQFAVALWVLAWAAFRRANIFAPICAERVQKFAPTLAILIPGLGALAGLDLRIAGLLYLLNLPLLGLVLGRLPVLAFGGISLIGALCCMPDSWIAQLSPLLTRGDFIAVIFASVTVGAIGMIRDARTGLIAALGVAIFSGMCGLSGAASINAAVLFLFVHHLRWNKIGRDEHLLLGIAGVIWIAQTVSLEVQSSVDARFACFVATIVATICLRNASLGRPTSLVPPISSIIVLCLHPIHWSATRVTAAPSGLLAILIGFALLAAGAWDSMRRWKRQRASR
ncbi:MAG TPA: hypothetical protein VI282_15265 [Verrucomicrobiae bacterium]